MSQELAVDGFKRVEEDDLLRSNQSFIKNYDENSDRGYILEVDIKYPKNFHKLHSDLPFLPERKKSEKCKNFICSIEDKKIYAVGIRALKQALCHGLIF